MGAFVIDCQEAGIGIQLALQSWKDANVNRGRTQGTTRHIGAISRCRPILHVIHGHLHSQIIAHNNMMSIFTIGNSRRSTILHGGSRKGCSEEKAETEKQADATHGTDNRAILHVQQGRGDMATPQLDHSRASGRSARVRANV